jgi:adenine deaminase
MKRTALLEAARGQRPLDLVIKNVNLVNVFTCEVYPADIGVYGDRIALVAPAGRYALEANRVIDGTGRWAAPGFVDTHLHIESTMVTPSSYAEAVLPFGTTTSIIDPHEIGNVLGKEGVRYMLETSEGLPLRVYLTIPSCVPAVPGKETAGADLRPEDVAEMLAWDRVIAVAEVMDYMGVVNGSPRMLGIVEAGHAADKAIQGHAPLLQGRDLNAYLAAGIENDHEVRQGDEGLEKLRLGMLPLLKVSSYGNHIPRILPTLKEARYLEIALCTDDIEPSDLLVNGHMDRVVREVISHGIEPAVAIRWATYTGARHYRLREHGAIAPGYLADFLLLSSLEDVRVEEVFVGGRHVASQGRMIAAVPAPRSAIPVTDTVHLPPLSADTFRLHAPVNEGEVAVNLISVTPTGATALERGAGRVAGGELLPATVGDDVCLLSVVPRHGQGTTPTLALLKGLGLTRGAIATTIAHDSHNVIVAGHQPEDMLLAVRELDACGGGIAIVVDGEVLGKVALPIAGLMSAIPVAELADEMRALNEVARSLGIQRQTPALAISGLALTVIPEVRISDLGALLDVATQEYLPVFPG